MPRSNRPRSRRGAAAGAPDDADLDRLRAGWSRTEVRRGREWKVQPISAAQALKTYLCPGCSLEIAPGQAHVVAWRTDGVLGDAADLAARRHWHSHCWNLA